MLTKLDIAAFRKADALCIHLDSRSPNGLVRLIKRNRRTDADPFATDVEHKVDAPVTLYNMRGRDEIKSGSASCFAHVNLYPRQHSHASSILSTLRANDEITFKFYPDAHSNGYCAMAGLHADVLMLCVNRKGKLIAEWELDVSTCPQNSARLCRGFADTESYRNSAAEARKVA